LGNYLIRESESSVVLTAIEHEELELLMQERQEAEHVGRLH